MPAPAQKPLLVGDRIDKYVIEKEIGAGGYGRVYRAKHEFLDTQVALKVMERADAMSPIHEARVEQEARVLGKLRHPNIVTVHDGGQDGDFLFIAMEELEGLNLGQHLRKHGPFDVVSGLRVLSSVCAALDCAHAQGVIHRDLKPGNLFLCSDGTVKVLDFGIAKVLGSEIKTQDNIYLGTAAYMSPEQITHRDVDARTDIYAVGLIAFEMFFGKRPLVVARPEVKRMASGDVLDLQLVVPTPRLDELLDGFPSYVARLVTTATAKDPTQRYETVLALKNKIDAHLKQYLQESRLEDSKGSPRRTMKLFPGLAPARPARSEQADPVSESIEASAKQPEKVDPTVTSTDITPPPSTTGPYSEPEEGLSWNKVLPFLVLGLAAVSGVASFGWLFGPSSTDTKVEVVAVEPVPLAERESPEPQAQEKEEPAVEEGAPASPVAPEAAAPAPAGPERAAESPNPSPARPQPKHVKKPKDKPSDLPLFGVKGDADTIPIQPPPARPAPSAGEKKQELWLD